jgi:hypothetical protein
LALLLAVARFVLDSEAATANLVTSESVTSMADAKKTDYPSAMALLAVARQYLEGAEIIFANKRRLIYPLYFLYFQTVESLLKAYLKTHGKERRAGGPLKPFFCSGPVTQDGWPILVAFFATRVGPLTIQAVLWLEWGFAAGPSLPAALSRFRAAHSHSISTLPAQPVAYWRKLLHSQSSARAHNPHFTGF